MQLQADFLATTCIRPQTVETTALGAAALAGLAIGAFSSRDDVKRVWQQDASFVPQMSASAREAKLAIWRKAVARAAL
jgi:glycerol kinase